MKICGIISCLLLSLFLPYVSHALTLVVYTNSNSGPGTLRQAITDNNGLGGGNTIIFSNVVTGTITLTTGELIITEDVTIVGPGAEALAISGNNASRVCVITNSAVATISDITIRNGRANGSGGGIRNFGTLFLSRCHVFQNSFVSGPANGAGLFNGGIAHIRDSTFNANLGNTFSGGGIHNTNILSLTNCTFTGNGALFGGAIESTLQMSVDSCTFVGNTNGIVVSGSATFGNCIIAHNTFYDVVGPCTSQGYNFVISAGSGAAFGSVGDQIGNTNLMLGPLQNNGGSTPTMLPLPGSPVIDQGKRGSFTDQRGRLRPYDNQAIINATAGDGSDIGAVEVSPASVYEWTFRDGSLSATLGQGEMTYVNNATMAVTSFGKTDGSTVPHINSRPTAFMHVPAFQTPNLGYYVTLKTSGPNGGGIYINQSTFIADVLLPNVNWMPFFNTNPLNTDDADFYISNLGSLGSAVYSAPGLISSNTWYRVASVANLASGQPTVTFYINGTQVAQNTVGSLDGRWSWFSSANPGPDLRLFNEGDSGGVYTREVYVAHVAMVDRNLSGAEIAELGAPAWDGIFSRQLEIKRTNDLVSINWRGASTLALQKLTNLTSGSGEIIAGTLGATNYTEPSSGAAYYRLVAP